MRSRFPGRRPPRPQDELEALLPEIRPQAPGPFVDALVARIEAETPAPVRRPARRLVPALVLTAALLAGLGSVGGLSYAASIAAQVAKRTARHAAYLGSKMPVAARVTQAHTAATDQYGGGGGGGQQGAQTETATPDSGGSITTQPTDSGSTIAVAWDAGTFTTTVAVTVDTRPPASTAFVGSAPALVSIVATDPDTNQSIHSLGSPLAVVFAPPPGGFPRGYVPLISTDGEVWRATAELSSPSLPSGQLDGFYTWKASDGAAHPAGTIIIITRHLTFFAVLYSANTAVSESGRQVPQAGSGLFGDPTRNHTGAPRMHTVGGRPLPVLVGTSLLVPVSFFVDEQAVVHLSVFDAQGNQKTILQSGTMLRGKRQSGPETKNLRFLVLRPGTIGVQLRLARTQILPGYRYKLRVWAVDYDGHATVRYIPFKG